MDIPTIVVKPKLVGVSEIPRCTSPRIKADDDVVVAAASTDVDEKSIDPPGWIDNGRLTFRNVAHPSSDGSPPSRRLRFNISYKRPKAARTGFSLPRGTGAAVVVARLVRASFEDDTLPS